LQRCGSSFSEQDGQKLAGVSSRWRVRSRAMAIPEFTAEFTLFSINRKSVYATHSARAVKG
jgi:hypothetical protein